MCKYLKVLKMKKLDKLLKHNKTKDDKKHPMHWSLETVGNVASILCSFKAELRTLGTKPA